MLHEFKTFISRGNVLDLAVGVIIGAAFAKIVTSLTESVIMPVVGWIGGGFDFTRYFFRLGQIPADYKGSVNDYAALKKAGVAIVGYGEFVTQVVQFVILAWVVFLIVKFANRLSGRKEEASAVNELSLLTEIRNELRKRGDPALTSH
ncbi:MAG TPA: large conductance mechanosensitive channel protein MscL [Novosphingobium sp.]|nr:large conductance mechanosensitive channel protein MscL [Novosphingobium sp.]